MGNGLVQKAGRIAGRAFGGTGDQGHSTFGDLGTFGCGNFFEECHHDFRLDPFQIEALATGQDCDRNLANLGGGQNKFCV